MPDLPERLLRRHLEQLARGWVEHIERDERQRHDLGATPMPSPYVYAGPAGFVLEHGVLEPAVVRSPALGAPRSCYGNAIVQATLGQHVGYPVEYCEGFAMAPTGLVVQHAWVRCVDVAVEVTWQTVGVAYLGVVFSVERADDATWNGDATVLDDPVRGWPLLRQRWAGEPDVQWPPSERLELIRTARLQPPPAVFAAIDELERGAGLV